MSTETTTDSFDTETIVVEHPFVEFLRMFMRNKAGILGFLMLLFIILTSIFGPLIYPVDPFEIVGIPVSPPGEDGWILGTDSLGRDLVAGLIHGSRTTLAVGAAAAACTVIIGLIIGALAGYYGGWVDNVLMRITEFFQVLPNLILAMVLITLFSPSLVTIVFSIGIVSWTGIARLTRAEFLSIREREYVMAAKSIGAENQRIIWRVILPNALPPLIVTAALNVGVAILFEAGLSFLSLGDPNVMSWGALIGDNREAFFEAWWAVTFPGLAIFATVLSVSLIGDGLNDALNPKLRER